jgi:glutathione S-transferase
MITLYALPPAFGLRNVSPFCLKTEMMLAHLKQPFELVEERDPRKTPKGKLPYLEWDGEVIADSERILEFLDQQFDGALFGDLTPQEIATGRAFTRLAEEHLYWMIVASRWLEDDWFPNVIEGFFLIAPRLIRGFVARQAQKQVEQTYYLQGLGRHSREEQIKFAREDLSALSDQIEAEGFITGGRLTVFDFTIASLLVGLMDNEPARWISKIAKDYPVLREYVDRIQADIGVFAK